MAGTDMMMNAAINALARAAGVAPEDFRRYLVESANSVASIGKRFETLESNVSAMAEKTNEQNKALYLMMQTVIEQNRATLLMLQRMSGNMIALEDDELLVKYMPGTRDVSGRLLANGRNGM